MNCFDASMAKTSKLIVHRIGNKSKEEGMVLSTQLSEIMTDLTEQYLNQFFFSSFKFDLEQQFFHESNINLNELYNYTSLLFGNENEFIEQSHNIAKHLYEVSTHPNIKKGELYIAYIRGCTLNDKKTDIIGVFKSETKDFYLDILDRNSKFDVTCKKGININKLEKGCLILDLGTKYPQKVFIVDTKRSDAYYWKKLFLNVIEVTNEYSDTTKVLENCKKFINTAYPDIQTTNKISLINNSIQYFEDHNNFEMGHFTSTVFKDNNTSENFKRYLELEVPDKNFEKAFTISPKAVKSIKKNIKNFIKLDSNIEIRINTQTKEMDEVVEKGYDNEKRMSYYKIYFKNEE